MARTINTAHSGMDLKELAIQSAIADVESGTSQRKAADHHGVARSTLQERLKGRQSHAIAHQDQQRLTPEQEDFLADWILSQDVRDQTPSPQRIREVAARIIYMCGGREPLGHLWLAHFIRRNPRVKCVFGRSARSTRNTTSGLDDMTALLRLSECTQVELGLQYGDLRGLQDGSTAQSVRTTTERLTFLVTTSLILVSQDGELIVIIETTLPIGRKVQCLAVIQRRHLQSTWFPARKTPDWLYEASENEWTVHTIGYEWLRRVFMPGSSPKSDRYRLLFSTATTPML